MIDQLITIETAKLAKEKEFNIITHSYYFEDGEFKENELTGTNGYYGEEYCFSFGEFYENWNDKWVTTKDGDRCFGCNKSNKYFETFSAPSQSLLQRWLREEHKINIDIRSVLTGYQYDIWDKKSNDEDINWSTEYNTYEEALEAGLQEGLKLIK